jgi:hypothetical protein
MLRPDGKLLIETIVAYANPIDAVGTPDRIGERVQRVADAEVLTRGVTQLTPPTRRVATP